MRIVNGVAYSIVKNCGRFSHFFRAWENYPRIGKKIRSCSVCGKIETKKIKKEK